MIPDKPFFSYYFVSHEELGVESLSWEYCGPMSFWGGTRWRALPGRREREKEDHLFNLLHLVLIPPAQGRHSVFLLGCLSSYIDSWIANELLRHILQRKLSLIQSKQEWCLHSQNCLSASHRKETLKTCVGHPISLAFRDWLMNGSDNKSTWSLQANVTIIRLQLLQSCTQRHKLSWFRLSHKIIVTVGKSPNSLGLWFLICKVRLIILRDPHLSFHSKASSR